MHARSILIVEDDLDTQAIYSEVLKHNGFMVYTAATALTGIELAFEHVPKAVLLDMHLPDRLGLVVASAIRREEFTRHIPIIAISGDMSSDLQNRALAAGCTTFMVKPVSPMALVAEALHHMRVGAENDTH